MSDDTAKRASRVAKDTGEELSAELAALREDVNAILKTLSGASKDVAGIAKDSATHAADDVMRMARDKLGDAKEKVDNIEDNIVRNVNANPLQSLALAFGAGFALSLFMRR